MAQPTWSPAPGISYKVEAGFIIALGFNKSGNQNLFLLFLPPRRKGPSLHGTDLAFVGITPPFTLLYFLISLPHHLKCPPCFLYLENDYSVFRAQFKSQMSLAKSVKSSHTP